VRGETNSTDPNGAGVVGKNNGGGPALKALVNAGAPPLAVNSSVRVDNLNADEFDGKNSTDFLAKDEVAFAHVINVNGVPTLEQSRTANVTNFAYFATTRGFLYCFQLAFAPRNISATTEGEDRTSDPLFPSGNIPGIEDCPSDARDTSVRMDAPTGNTMTPVWVLFH
jgi:hypothetical protein